MHDGCFCNCTTLSENYDFSSSSCVNVGNCNNERYTTLMQNFNEAGVIAEACGCGENLNQILPQDDEGFIVLNGSNIHCPTACWEQENIFDLLYDSEIIPLEGFGNQTARIETSN